MKYQTLIDILFILLSRKKVTARYLAERFDLSLRSIYRYIDELSLSVPIYNERGRNGGYSVYESFRLPSAFLTKEESDVTLDALNGVNKELHSAALLRVIDKLGAVRKDLNDERNISVGNFIIDGGPWTSDGTFKNTLRILQAATEDKRALIIKYRDRDGTLTERTVEPHIMVLKQGLWYVYAYCRLRKTFRLFKVGRIAAVKTIDEFFERKPVADIENALKEWYGNLKTEQVELIADEEVRSDLEEWLGVDKVFATKDGLVRASVSLPIDKTLTAKIMSFMGKVKVLSPESLRVDVLAAAKAIELTAF